MLSMETLDSAARLKSLLGCRKIMPSTYTGLSIRPTRNRGWQTLPFTVVFALLVAARIFAQSNPPGAGAANPFAGDEQAIAEGHVIYNRSCTMCHGHDGAAGDRAPALAATRRYMRNSDRELFDAVRNGIPGTQM